MDLKCELRFLSQPDGSALLASDRTVVIASVYGPIEVKPQRLMIDKASVEVIYKPNAGQPGIGDRLMESTICNVLQVALLSSLHPRTCISIQIQEMQDCGGLLACAVNAACLALINSGLSMKFLVAAVCCIIDHDNQVILHPNLNQIEVSKARFTFVFEGINKKVVATETNGLFSSEEFHTCLETCRTASTSVFQFYRDIVKKYAEKIS